MNPELIEDFLRKSELTPVQSQALAKVFAEMSDKFATKADVAGVKAELVAVKDTMATKAELVAVRETMAADLARLETALTKAIGRQTAWMVSIIVVLATLLSLLNRLA